MQPRDPGGRGAVIDRVAVREPERVLRSGRLGMEGTAIARLGGRVGREGDRRVGGHPGRIGRGREGGGVRVEEAAVIRGAKGEPGVGPASAVCRALALGGAPASCFLLAAAARSCPFPSLARSPCPVFFHSLNNPFTHTHPLLLIAERFRRSRLPQSLTRRLLSGRPSQPPSLVHRQGGFPLISSPVVLPARRPFTILPPSSPAERPPNRHSLLLRQMEVVIIREPAHARL